MATVRHATTCDANLIAALTRLCWAGSSPADSSAHGEDEARVLRDLECGGGLILEHADAVVASLRWRVLEGAWEVCRLGVLPQYRRHGHGARLMHEVEALAVGRGVRELRLAVRRDASLKLVQFYQHLGYAIDPALAYSHVNPKSPAPIVMRKALLHAAVAGKAKVSA